MVYYLVMNIHFRALAEPNRIHIVQLLQNGSLPVGEIATKLHLNQPQVSKHLRVLADAGLVESQQVARQHIYALKPQSFKKLETWISSYHSFTDDKFDRLDTYLSTLQGKEKTIEEKNALQTVSQTDQELVITRMFDAPRTLVYKAYTDPQFAKGWWGLKTGTTTTIDKMDVRPGGLWRFIQRDANGNEYACSGIYREVMSDFLLVYTFTMENVSGYTAVKMVKFEEISGKTKLTDTTFFQTIEDREKMITSGIEKGVHKNMNNLSKFLKTGKA